MSPDRDRVRIVRQHRATVPTADIGCYWGRLRDTSGGPGSTIANGLGQPVEQVIFTIAPTDVAIKVSGCGTWMKIG